MSKVAQKYKEGLQDKFEDVEYIEVSKDGLPVHTYSAKEVNGITKYEFQIMLGQKFGVDKFHASMKFKDNYTNKKFPIRSIVIGENKMTKTNNKPDTSIKKVDELESIIKQLSKQNPQESFNQLLDLTKITYQTEIDRNKETISDLKEDIRTYKLETKELDAEILKLKNKIIEFESESGDSGNFLEMLTQLNKLRSVFKPGSVTQGASPNLNDVRSDAGDIPKGFIDALGKVDYSKVPEGDIEKYIALFDNIATQLPLKTKE